MALLVSCSIKEERYACPCELYLEFEEMVPGSGSILWCLTSESYSFRDCGFLSYDEWPEGLLFSVPRGKIGVDMLVADSSADLSEKGMVISEGRDCPYVYSFNRIVECDSSEARDTIVLHKKFALLYCYVSGMDELQGEMRFEISGNVNGYAPDGAPVAGQFRYDLRMEKASELQEVGCVSLPAQTDGSLRLNLYSYDGNLSRSFAIGEYILDSGYDWSREDLEDISLEIDFINTGVVVSTVNRKTKYFDIDAS